MSEFIRDTHNWFGSTMIAIKMREALNKVANFKPIAALIFNRIITIVVHTNRLVVSNTLFYSADTSLL